MKYMEKKNFSEYFKGANPLGKPFKITMDIIFHLLFNFF